MKESTAKWLIFTVMFTVTPVFVYGGMIAGFLSMSVILRALIATPGMKDALLLAPHLLIYGAAFYALSRFAARLLWRLSEKPRALGLTALCFVLAIPAALPIYGWCYAGCDHLFLIELYAKV